MSRSAKFIKQEFGLGISPVSVYLSLGRGASVM
jgi:hypothetical protein